MMVPAGKPVDSVIAHLGRTSSAGDILIDGGNSLFTRHRSPQRRARDARASASSARASRAAKKARCCGPAIMPGGPRRRGTRWRRSSARSPRRPRTASRASRYMGPRGAGHYVKMVHNGIEYGDMQLIAEVYDLLHRGARACRRASSPTSSPSGTRASCSRTSSRSPRRCFERDRPRPAQPLVDVILDEAQQKGTGKWMSQNALDVGAPIPTINAAVEARILSALKTERVAASKVLRGPSPAGARRSRAADRRGAPGALRQQDHARTRRAWRCCGMASNEYGYDIDPGEVAKIWRAGCIIRAACSATSARAFERDPALVNLLLDEPSAMRSPSGRTAGAYVVQTAVGLGIPVAGDGRRRSPTTMRTAARACRRT